MSEFVRTLSTLESYTFDKLGSAERLSEGWTDVSGTRQRNFAAEFNK